MSRLQDELDRLEREDPAVRAATDRYTQLLLGACRTCGYLSLRRDGWCSVHRTHVRPGVDSEGKECPRAVRPAGDVAPLNEQRSDCG